MPIKPVSGFATALLASLSLAACQPTATTTAATPQASATPAAASAPTPAASEAAPVAIHGSGWRNADVPKAGDQSGISLKIFTPCADAAKTPFVPGPFNIDATPGCPIAGPAKLPLIVLSHGRGGNFHSHHDTATALAKEGFIVVTFSHPGDETFDMSNTDDISVLYHRPVHVKRVIDYMLGGAPIESARIDPQRIGFVGFSRGGYTGLILAGATPDFANTKMPCPPEEKICAQWAKNEVPNLPLVTEPRIKAMAIVDPLSFFTTPETVKNVNVPMQLWGSQLGGDGVTPENVALLAKNLSNKPDFKVIPNTNHFSYLNPCSPALAALEPGICTKDPAGLDRAAMHKDWNAQMAAFFKQTLGG